MITVWGRRNSANVQKVLWLLDDLDTPWQHRDAGGTREPETRQELLARNPNGLVPVLEDDGLTLWESNAILRHLVRTALPSARYGNTPSERALIDQWMDWQLATLWPPMLPFFIGLARTAEDERDHMAIEAGRQRTMDNFQILEVWLGNGGTEYIVGAELTVADIAIGPFLHRWLLLEPSASAEQPHLAALYQRYREHRAFQSRIMTQPF